MHHCKPFSKILEETINEIGLLDETLFRNVMLGKQLVEKYLTLCNKCHKNIHKEIKNAPTNNFNFKMYNEINKKLKNKNNKKSIKKYLNKLIGKRLHKEEREELINKLNIRYDGRLKRGKTCISKYLLSEFNMKLISKKVKENGKKITVWIINK